MFKLRVGTGTGAWAGAAAAAAAGVLFLVSPLKSVLFVARRCVEAVSLYRSLTCWPV